MVRSCTSGVVRRRPKGNKVRVRCGVHSGAGFAGERPLRRIAVHRAARICSAAHGGQVLVSQTTADLSADDEVATLSLRDLGPHRLKDLTEPQELYQLVAEGLASEFPPPKTLENRPTNLPVQATALIGREKVMRRGQCSDRSGRRVAVSP